MDYKIVNYDLKRHYILDKWIDESEHVNAKLINKYATYNEPISNTYKYFLDNPFDMANIKTFLKVFEHDHEFYGVAVFHYYKEEEKFYLAINPIVINPKFINQGIGTKILKQIVENVRQISGGHVDIIKGDTEESNLASIRILEKSGFIKDKQNDNFIEYTYDLTKKNGSTKPLI